MGLAEYSRPIGIRNLVAGVGVKPVNHDIGTLDAEILHKPDFLHEEIFRCVGVVADKFLAVVSTGNESLVRSDSSPIHESGEVVSVTVLGIPFDRSEGVVDTCQSHVEIARILEKVIRGNVALDSCFQEIAGNGRNRGAEHCNYSFRFHIPCLLFE